MTGPEEPRKKGIGTLLGAQSAGTRHNAGRARAVARPVATSGCFCLRKHRNGPHTVHGVGRFVDAYGIHFYPRVVAILAARLSCLQTLWAQCRGDLPCWSRNGHCLLAVVSPALLSMSSEPPFFLSYGVTFANLGSRGRLNRPSFLYLGGWHSARRRYPKIPMPFHIRISDTERPSSDRAGVMIALSQETRWLAVGWSMWRMSTKNSFPEFG